MKPSREPVRAVVALGANLGNAVGTVRGAIDALQVHACGHPIQRSSLWRSAPIEASGPDFVNAVVEFDTRLSAADLLRALQSIESAAGRERPYRNAPRTLDLDLIFFGTAQISSETLTVPHPRYQDRAFVLRPLSELRFVDPQLLQSVADQRIERMVA